MTKTLHIIPGYGHNVEMPEYKKIGKCAQEKGYHVLYESINWTQPISKQIIKLKKTDVVFGFSLGATIARLSYQKTPCKKIILASNTPLYRMTKKILLKATCKNMALTDDIILIKNRLLQSKLTVTSCVYLSGDRENLRGKKIKGTNHALSKLYIQTICDLL